MPLDNLAQLTASLPHSQPSPEECNDMTRRAKEVVRLLEVLRRMGMPEADRIKMDSASVNSVATEDHRPPKRPWEDIQGGPGESSFSEVSYCRTILWALMETDAWRFFSSQLRVIRNKRQQRRIWKSFARSAQRVRQGVMRQQASPRANIGREALVLFFPSFLGGRSRYSPSFLPALNEF